MENLLGATLSLKVTEQERQLSDTTCTTKQNKYKNIKGSKRRTHKTEVKLMVKHLKGGGSENKQESKNCPKISNMLYYKSLCINT